MIDYLKLKVTNNDLIKHLWSHPLIYFYSEKETLLNDKETIHTQTTKQYKGIYFYIENKILYIKFKPHYYFNNNLHNANDFHIINCIRILKEFINTFQVNPYDLYIVNIEFGINVIIPKSIICIKDLLAQMIYHNQNEFYPDKSHAFSRRSTTIRQNGKINLYKVLKCYAKGIQYPQYTDINTLRYEIKSCRKNYINNLGIYNLNDLLNKEIYNKLADVLIKEFEQILIIDDNAKPILSDIKLKHHKKRLCQIHWRKLTNKSKNTFRKNITAYNDALDTCETHLKKELTNLIIKKLDELKSVPF
ncbi:hypothetical protein [Oceanihabitans sediminis]|uniref:hypothetical protein n=1 Tax=Oceanihabitans sediminis TaxID=1812012 RepID=UPI00299CFA00|nr:hypothetical protein [Oceanihabitans sediminis]MDX1278383.1 hypothetical protein [Oceanihabitans sediminis]